MQQAPRANPFGYVMPNAAAAAAAAAPAMMMGAHGVYSPRALHGLMFPPVAAQLNQRDQGPGADGDAERDDEAAVADQLRGLKQQQQQQKRAGAPGPRPGAKAAGAPKRPAE